MRGQRRGRVGGEGHDERRPERGRGAVLHGQSGDNLSKNQQRFYGDPNRYMKIFEANKRCSHPDKIYPGQNLRIPPA